MCPIVSQVDATQTYNLVSGRFAMSEDLISQYEYSSETALNNLADFDFSVPLGNLDFDFDNVTPPNIGDAPAPEPIDEYVSQLQAVIFSDLTALREQLGLIDITLDQVDLPVLEAISPNISFPDAPDDTIPDVPSDIPDIRDPDIPVAPGFDLPPVPVLDEIDDIPVPELENLTFNAELPSVDLTPPDPMFVYSEGTYESDLRDALKTKLYNDVTLGGTGLSEEVEQAIYDRALTRLNTELEAAYNQTLKDWAAWNCDMPDGVLSGALREVIFENDRARLDLDRDILRAQAELAQQNTHFAISNGLVHEKQIMDFTNQVNNRAFAVAQYRVQAVIEVFNAKVVSYNSQLDGVKTLAQIFESRIRAEISKVEKYRVQMEGLKIKGELQEQKVRIYTARVQAINTLIDIYRAQMEGARLQLAVDSEKIKAFQARVSAVVAQIQGVTAKYNLYQAQISGESSKVDLYGKQVSAYATQVQAAKVTSDINVSEMQALIESNRDRMAILSAAIEKYKSDTQYEMSKEDANIKAHVAKTGVYEAQARRETEFIRSKVEAYRAQITEAATRVEAAIKELDANLRAATASKEIQVEALKALANILTQKVASALSSVSASAQLGYNGQLSNSYSQSDAWQYIDSKSKQEGESTSTNTNYNHSVNDLL